MATLNSFQARYVNQIRKYFPAVNRVADATAPILIHVKECDVDKAKKMKHNACAMAKACERDLSVDGALISPSVSYLIRGDLAIRYKTPASVGRELVSFDRHKDFRPGEYQLTAIPKSHRIGKHPGGKGGTGKGQKRLKPLVSRPSDGLRAKVFA
jgi:hypothetical protein